jgi:membrane protein YqaA with SNARE-associated domain
MKMLQRLYVWVMRLAASRHATVALVAIAFAESSFFPIPPDTMLVPMVLARPERAWLNAAVCTGGSILGGVLGYYIGFSLQPVAHWILAITGHPNAEVPIIAAFAKYGVAVILLGLVPVIPYKLITIATGLAHFVLWQFILASCVTRTTRFFGVTFLTKRFGPAVLPVLEKRMKLIGAVVLGAAIAAFVIAKLLHHA